MNTITVSRTDRIITVRIQESDTKVTEYKIDLSQSRKLELDLHNINQG